MSSFKSFGQSGGSKFRDDQVIIDSLDLGVSGYWLRAQRVDKAGNILSSSVCFVSEPIQAGIKFIDISSTNGTVFAQMITANGRVGLVRDNKKENVDIFYSSATEAAGGEFVKKDGTTPLTADWDIGDGFKIKSDEIAARDAAGLKLSDDAGNGPKVVDGGHLAMGNHNLSLGRGDDAEKPIDLKMFSAADAVLMQVQNFNEEFPIFWLRAVSERAVVEMYDEAEGLNIKLDPGGNSYFRGGKLGIGTPSPSANADLTLEGGVLNLKETGTPTNDLGYGKLYTKSDNNLYFQDGAGNERTVNVT